MSRVIKKCCNALRKNYVDEFIVSYLPVQKQTSGYNCGLFDIVFAADILDGKCSCLSIFIMFIPAGLYSRFFVFVILFLFAAIVYNGIRFRMQWKLTSHTKLKIMHLEQDSSKKPIESTVLVKGLVIALPYLDKMSLQIRSRINRIMKNKLPYCILGFALQIKCKLVAFLYLKTGSYRFYVQALFINFRVVTAMLPVTAKLNVILSSEYVNTWEIQHSLGKKLKAMLILPLKNILFRNYSPDFENFSIFTTSNSDFKITLIDSLLINRDQPPLNKTKQFFPLKLFDN